MRSSLRLSAFESGLDWKALSLSPKDMDFAESKAGAAREIALAFGVPPLLLGLPGDNTFANYAEANRAFWRQTVLPLVLRVQKSFQSWLRPAYGEFRLDYNADRLDALASERAAEWERVGKAPFLTLDEQREAVGYGPAPRDAFATLAPAERRYSPGQPRVPAGSPDGGQWTNGGGGGGEAPSGSINSLDESSTAEATFQQVSDNLLIDLRDDEGGAHNGHAISDHVGKSDNQLRNRIHDSYEEHWRLWAERDTRAGSFPSVEAANKLVNAVIARNEKIVQDVISGRTKGRIRIDAFFSSPTGREAYTPDPWKRNATIFFGDTHGAAVVIMHDKRSKRGFSIITAFPLFD